MYDIQESPPEEDYEDYEVSEPVVNKNKYNICDILFLIACNILGWCIVNIIQRFLESFNKVVFDVCFHLFWLLGDMT